MKPRSRQLAGGVIAANGVIHLVLAPEYFTKQPYLGVLFVMGALACAFVGVRLWRRDDTAAWMLGSLTAAGMGIGFVLSRTVGLPGFQEAEWELSGLVTLALEVGFISAAATALRSLPGAAPDRSHVPTQD